ncbi:clavesin-2-like isoform X1 [Leguminivora glycinivorella]|uniref:clavesin-2-like isoform X1 n=1 Tax=Leguminivora glycinivorella TaxID=1035111 RepID=UPI00200CBFE7|nr:clavesin-2-like isoform X1 [Leguminivora glycinivorella]XP_048000070.1 clavesin-2-like isoform X1 [Leguminivora glycinivorella]XP_048000072.1 clavesin-2-like isoform X1 [Leguminivora glycinivorella]
MPINECVTTDRFIDLAYAADVDTSEHPELLELARELVAEEPDTRAAAIQELRDMVYERGECSPRRLDDAFLLRFLRARRFVVRRAHRQLVRYCNFLEQYPSLYRGVDLFALAKVKGAYEAAMLDRPGVGRLLITRFGAWDPDEFPVEDLVRASLAMMEMGLRTPKMQVLGATGIFDLQGVTLRHVATLTPTVAYQIVCLSGYAMPGIMNSCHIINYNWLLHTFFFLFKRFIRRAAWSRIHFHGSDLESLHQHIPRECLPPRYGGSCRLHTDYATGMAKVRQYRTAALERDMRELGWVLNDD